MRVIALSALRDFWEGKAAHADAREPTLAWYRHALHADWRSPADVKREFGTASILRDGRVVGAEALMRWRHPTLGLLTPAAFIDALAASSVAADVGMWLLHTACAQARAWSLTFPDEIGRAHV